MRASAAVTLLLASSATIFGLYAHHAVNPSIAPGPEPVYVDGQAGVIDPDTGEFVPTTSPQFEDACERIRRRRESGAGSPNGFSGGGGYGYGTSGYSNHWYYYPYRSWAYRSGGTSSFGSSIGSSSPDSFSHGGSSFHGSSTRGGIGSTGHSFGASAS